MMLDVAEAAELLKQQAYVNYLENSVAYEWEYGSPQRGNMYDEMANEQRKIFHTLLKRYGITPESIKPPMLKVVIPENIVDDYDYEDIDYEGLEEHIAWMKEIKKGKPSYD